MRGGDTRQRQRKLLPLTLTLSPLKSGEGGHPGRCAPPAPIAAWAAACWRRPTAGAARRLQATRTIPPISAGCAPRAQHSATRWDSKPDCSIRRSAGGGSAGTRPSITSRSSIARIADAHGPAAIAFYLSGQLLTEDYYVANKLAKGFIGTPHVDTNSRLCMASSVAGHRRAFGADIVPQCYDDLELADLVVLVGSNAAWCHPILYQRIQVARAERGVRVVNIDPRRTATSEGADLHLAIKPGTDAQLWNGLLSWLSDYGALDRRFIDEHTEGFAAALASARMDAGRVAQVAQATGLPSNDIEQFYWWWTISERVVTCYSQGVNQSAHGTDKVNAIINCHLATGRIGKPGAGPLSLTGQPNAMGGREVGGLSNMLAAHMGFSAAERDRVRRFWGAPNLVEGEGHKAVQMFEAVAAGDIKALVGDGHQSRGQPAARRSRARCARAAGAAGRVGERREQRHGEPGSRTAARRGVGREGRHGHQLRAAHLAPACLPGPAMRSAARLVDPVAGGGDGSAGQKPSPIARRPTSFASMRACPASRTMASGCSIYPALPD